MGGGGGGGGFGGVCGVVVDGRTYMSSLLKRLKADDSGNFKVTHDKYSMKGM